MHMSVHNLELVRDFDSLIVIDNGALLDSGPPAIVCARCDYFSRPEQSIIDSPSPLPSSRRPMEQ
jgi:ABC-type transport system involved in cytochrome bd biosynthesis fused ATPase/permease subunit